MLVQLKFFSFGDEVCSAVMTEEEADQMIKDFPCGRGERIEKSVLALRRTCVAS